MRRDVKIKEACLLSGPLGWWRPARLQVARVSSGFWRQM